MSVVNTKLDPRLCVDNCPRVSYSLLQYTIDSWIRKTYKQLYNAGFHSNLLMGFKYELVIYPIDDFVKSTKAVKYYPKDYTDFVKKLYRWVNIRNCESYYYFEFKNGIIFANIFTY